MDEILNQLQKIKQMKALPFIIKDIHLYQLMQEFVNRITLLYLIHVGSIWRIFLFHWVALSTPDDTATSPWTTPAGESIAECFWAIASWHPGDRHRCRTPKPETKIAVPEHGVSMCFPKGR